MSFKNSFSKKIFRNIESFLFYAQLKIITDFYGKLALANGYQLSCRGFALNSHCPSRRVTTGGGDYKQVTESLHAPTCPGASPLAQQTCTFMVNQPKANACRTGVTFQIRFAGERESMSERGSCFTRGQEVVFSAHYIASYESTFHGFTILNTVHAGHCLLN